MSTSTCRFCEIQKGNVIESFDHPIKESDRFFSLASIGAFIPGWSLVVPKKHVYSLRELYSDPDFLLFSNSWIDYVGEIFEEKVIIFEHGANRCGSQTSCGTNHAHLHVVPYGKSLVEKIMEDRRWVCVDHSQIQSVVQTSEYLLYADINKSIEDSKIYIHLLENEESQYFRRMLSEDLNTGDYSYKSSPHVAETNRSYEILTRVKV